MKLKRPKNPILNIEQLSAKKALRNPKAESPPYTSPTHRQIIRKNTVREAIVNSLKKKY